MPEATDAALDFFVNVIERELRKQTVQPLAVNRVYISPRNGAGINGVHARPVTALPFIHELFPGNIDAPLISELPQVNEKASAPVHHGAVHVEGQRSNYR